MTAALIEFLSGILCLVAGAIIGINLDRIARFDQVYGAKLKSWRSRRLGTSFPNREFWSTGTASGFLSLKIVLQIVAVILSISGLMLVCHSFVGYFR